MKKLIFILMVGSLVATSDDSSSLDLLILRSSESYNGEYISIDEKYIYFKPSSSLTKQAVEKTMIEKVVLSDGTVIFDYVKSIDKYMLESDDQNLLLLKKYKDKIGGGLIALGSGLLIYNTNRECNNCGLDFDEYNDSLKRTATIGYLLIAIGGIFLAL